MNISDIITLVSLVIAIIAILTDKNRKHLLLKFHVVDYIFFAGAFFLINYFVFYDHFYSKELYLPYLYFQNFGLTNPKNYSYLISICSLGYFFYKIWYSFYPSSKLKKVTRFYEQLIEMNEISFLLDLIDRYHKNDIIKTLKNTSSRGIKKYDTNDKFLEYRYRIDIFKKGFNKWYEKSIRFLLPYSRMNRKAYAHSVLHGIINNPAFIMLASNQRPHMFAEIFTYFKKEKRGIFPTDLINLFLMELILHHNFWLKKELKQSQNMDFGQPDWFHSENKILSSLVADLSVADANSIWQPFGDTAIDEIEEERLKGFDSKMFQTFREEQFLWDYKTYFAIQFFKVLITEAINKQYLKCHFWLEYYWSISDSILKTFEKYPPKNFNEVETTYHSFIDIMLGNMFLWLEISNQSKDKGFYKNILTCLGNMTHSICENDYYGEKRKQELIEKILNYYCDLYENSETLYIRESTEKILLKPSTLTDPLHSYYIYLGKAWADFDKIPHMTELEEDYDYFERLKEKVIIPLGLNPDDQTCER